MILSDKTISVLKNFSGINQSILVRPGNTLRTISPEKNLMGRVDVAENFTQEFAIYDLRAFLGVMSLFQNPDLIFSEDHVKITDGKNSVTYIFADPRIIVSPQNKDIKLPSVDVQVTISQANLASVLKAASLMGVPDISIKGEDGKIVLFAHDKKNPKTNNYSVEVGTTESVFSVDFKAQNFKFVEDDYNVEISSKLISSLTGTNTGVNYFMACEATSTFG